MTKDANRFVVISGCSAGGKSTLLAELALRGHRTIEEPGRRIVADEIRHGGDALPWTDPVAFARRAVDVSLADLEAAATASPGWVFFDRGLIDAAAALQHLTGEPALRDLGCAGRYNTSVFMAPPWQEIFETDDERRHGFADAVAEYDRLANAYPSLGFEVHILPRRSARERADYVMSILRHQSQAAAKT